MSEDSAFAAFLNSKNIDSEAFKNAEPGVWETWKNEFDQMHPASFTVQKLNLINAIRRKYLRQNTTSTTSGTEPKAAPAQPVAKPGRPLMKPRTK